MGIFDSIKEKMLGESAPKAPQEMLYVEDQPKEDIELCSFVKQKVEESRIQGVRVASEGIWMTNIAYLLGFDSVYYDPTLRQYRVTDNANAYLRRDRLHSNIIMPAVQNRLARMCKNPPKYEVRPESQEEDAKEAARLTLDVIDATWDRQHINKKRIELGMWLQECGHAYLKASWDDQLGDPMLDPVTGDVVGFQGGVRIDVVSAFECFPDALAKNFDELGHFTQAKVRKLEYFRSHYDRGHLVKEEGAWLLSSEYEMRINSLNQTGTSSSNSAEQMKNAAIELSYYEKRSKKYPKGRHVITANGVLLKNDILPVGEIPFAKFDDVTIGGKYYSEALITQARPLQDQYNLVLKKRQEWIQRLLNGKYIAAKGHGVMQEGINDQSGEVVEYDHVPQCPPPQAMTIPTMPQYAYTEGDNIKRELYELFGLSDISRGQLPSSSIPAKGMEILLEQDETRIGIETEQHEHAFARIGKLIAKLEAKYVITPRKLKKRGNGLEYSITEYTGADLMQSEDVTVIRGSTIPNVKAIKRNDIMNAYSQGLLGNPADPIVRELVLGMMEFGDANGVWADYRVDMNQIQSTIKMIEQENIPLVNRLDNHSLHVLIKNRYRKSDKWDLLTPDSKLLMEKDIDAHIAAGAALMDPSITESPDSEMPQQPPEIDQIENSLQNNTGGL